MLPSLSPSESGLFVSPPCVVGTAHVEDKAIDALVLAFSADPVCRWTWPEPQRYLRYFGEFARAFGGNAFTYGSAYRAGDYAGAALWLPPGVEPDMDRLTSLFLQSVPADRQKDFFAVFEGMGAYHPDEPHWYLPLVGVDPAHHNKGYGAALMKHALLACDRDGTPAYLESTNPRNISLYERHGFEVLGIVQSGSTPPVTPMLRRPR